MFKASMLIFILCASMRVLAWDLRNPRNIQNWKSYAIMGDAGVNNSTTAGLRSSIAKAGLNELILPGDNLYNPLSSYENVWDVWKKNKFIFSIVAIGNHNGGYANEIKYFGMPSEFFAVESKGAYFFVLNSDNESNANIQIQWLDKALATSQAPFNFLVYHHPSVTLTERHNWQEKGKFQVLMRQLIAKYEGKITAILNGHDHAAGLIKVGKTPLVVSGSSWESLPFKVPVPKDPQFAVDSVWGSQKGGFYWNRLDYNALTKEVYIHFNRFDRQEQPCTIRISPAPMGRSSNCQ